MKHAKQFHSVRKNDVRDNIRCSDQNEFARSFDAARPSHVRKGSKLLDRSFYRLIHIDRGDRIAAFQIIENSAPVGKRLFAPNQAHCLARLRSELGPASCKFPGDSFVLNFRAVLERF